MYVFKMPDWINTHKYLYKSFEEVPDDVFEIINMRLRAVQLNDPIVSIVIAAWNEEINILNCISSLSNMKTNIPFEIIVVNNNSTDNTQNTIDKLRVKKLFQKIQGCGPARQMGQEHARGKYVLLADADCLYPDSWVDTMINELRKTNVVCVYGRYSFIGERAFPRWKLFIYEFLKDLVAEIRHIKRPYLNSFGMSMGYIKDLGLKVGYVERMVRGEDGRLCFDLMKYGKVKQVRSNIARVWTEPRTLQLDGSLGNALGLRIKIELRRFFSLFSAHPPHDTKTSNNK